MMTKRILILWLGLWATSFLRSNVFAEETEITAEQLTFFETKIRPVLIKDCYGCHSTKTGNAKGGLRLDSQQLMHLGGSSGPAVVPGDAESSLLFNAITYQDFAMPPDRRLAPEVIENFRKWIEMGAPDPRRTDAVSLNSKITAEDIQKAKAEFWAYQPLKASQVSGKSAGAQTNRWVKSDIDQFVLASLEQAGLSPAEDATANQLLRRLSFDLIGLPPAPEQIDAFERKYRLDPDQAISEAVDALLDSPQFGERWGRHWLDLARYAESNGREVNMTFPQAWRYRDYVIDAFNADKPYDRFIQEQIAGDLLPVKTDEQWTENLIATGFLAIGPKSLSEQNRVQFAVDLADEQLDVTTRVFLGTSVACARCHDHKFDPIPQADYYALAGIFANTKTYFGVPASEFGALGGIQNRNTTSLIILPVADPNPFDREFSREDVASMTEEIRSLRQGLFEARRSLRSNTSTANQPQTQVQTLVRTQARIEAVSSVLGSVDENGRPITFCMGVQDRDNPVDSRVLVRGEIDQPAQVVKRDFPQVLRQQPAEISEKSSGRLELARWLSSKDNPLTARVMVNRIWQHLLGSGIVRSTEDFGSTGQPPTHPELLDQLAIQFIDSGWSIKSMVRSIATSRTYRMSAQHDEAKFLKDPDNALLWRANPKRLTAEAIRDSMLLVSEQIDLTRPRASEVAKAGYMQVRDGNLLNINQVVAMTPGMSSMNGPGGERQAFARQMMRQDPAGFTRLTRDMRSGNERVDMVDATYRSIYLPTLRDELPRSMEVFDLAEPSMVIGSRESSNTPNQSLYLLNNEFVLKQSEAFATRLMKEAKTVPAQVTRAFELAYGRPPTNDERQASLAFMSKFSGDSKYRQQAAMSLAALCQSLFASAEFRYLE
jgi:hypothetical protein